MISYPASLLAVGGAKTGIAPVNLLDVQDVNGNLYFWSDRPCNAPIRITGAIGAIADAPVSPSVGEYVTWATAQNAAVSELQSNVTPSNVGDTTGKLLVTTHLLGQEIGGKITWSNFGVPALPPNAVIKAVYPVAIISVYGLVPTESTFTMPSSSQGQVNLASIGNTVEVIESFEAYVSVGASAPGAFPDYVEFDYIALAVYYTISSGGGPGYSLAGTAGIQGAPYLPWLMSVPSLSLHRSLQTDMGSFLIQNLSGDTLSRDMEKYLRASALEGAFFVYRLWQPDAEAAWLEVHGTLTVDEVGVDTITLKGEQLINASQDDTPLETYCETCQIQWGGRRCGSTQPTECSYSMQTCQVVERIMVALNDYEKNFGEATANVTSNRVINRRRKI